MSPPPGIAWGGGGGKRHQQPEKPPSIRKVFKHFKPFLKNHRLAIILGTSCVALALILGKINPLITRFLIDDVLTPVLREERSQDLLKHSLQLLVSCISLMIALSAISSLISHFRMKMMRKAGASMVQEIRLHVYQHLQKLSLRFYESRQTGDIMSRLTGDVGGLERLITHISDRLLTDILNMVVTVTILFFLNWKLALVALIPVPILITSIGWFGKTIRPIYRKVRDRMGSIHTKLQDNISGIRVIKAFSTEKVVAKDFEKDNREFFDEQMKEVKLTSKIFPFIRFLDSLGVIAVTGYGSYMILQPSPEITIGDLFAFNAFVLQLYQPIGSIFQMYNVTLQALASGERVAEILETEPDVIDEANASDLPSIHGLVEFNKVSFHYSENTPVLEHISIKAFPGEIIALVGPSGTGKTSIINLLLRFYDPTEGAIMLDGHDIKKVTQASLRSQIAVVLQDPFLFNGTILDNIRYACPNANLEQVVDAAKAANAAEFIDDLECGYETQIGERGVKLSGGQKQRLAIARALLTERKILILDEATSMIDSHSEYLIKNALDRLMQNRTTFIIAHRLSTIKHADNILVLNHHSIVESGTHNELMALEGKYTEMVQDQFRLDRESPSTKDE